MSSRVDKIKPKKTVERNLRIPQQKRDKLALSKANHGREGGRPEDEERNQNERKFREGERG
jgi:hypothetical protein